MTSAIQLSLFSLEDGGKTAASSRLVTEELRSFSQFGKKTVVRTTRVISKRGEETEVPTFVNEYWTSKQRAAHPLHEVSYRACFKPQLPKFFIDRLTRPGDIVYDPFMGRGTTPLEAALNGRVPYANDINPLSRVLVQPRLAPPTVEEVASRLQSIRFDGASEHPEDLLVFYHPETLGEICALRTYLLDRERDGALDAVDAWIRMVAVNRLTGHSPGFFSVYTLPPNQAVSVAAQRKINLQRNQQPPRRDVPKLVLRKSKQLLSGRDEATLKALRRASETARLLTKPADQTPEIPDESVALVVTSPPFLDVVDYAQDNWLRCWFCGIDPESVAITTARKIEDWRAAMQSVFYELARVLKPGGHVAFEVGEVRSGKVKLEEVVVPLGIDAGLRPELILINDQQFTKTAHCWGVDNNRKGTNTNRIVLLRRPRRP